RTAFVKPYGLPESLWGLSRALCARKPPLCQKAPVNYFDPRISKNVGRGIVPDLNHSLSVRENDGIRSLINNKPENLKAIIAAQQAHGYLAFALRPTHPALWRRRPWRQERPCGKLFQ